MEKMPARRLCFSLFSHSFADSARHSLFRDSGTYQFYHTLYCKRAHLCGTLLPGSLQSAFFPEHYAGSDQLPAPGLEFSYLTGNTVYYQSDDIRSQRNHDGGKWRFYHRDEFYFLLLYAVRQRTPDYQSQARCVCFSA